MLVSSRAALRIRSERVFPVEPLPLPAGGEEPADSPAVQLFVQRALAADPKLRIDGNLAATASRICRALDGLPLPIELAASQVRLLTPAQVAEQVEHAPEFSAQAARDLPDRQRTLQATIQWSHDLLQPPVRELLRTAGAFRGGFTLEALAAVADRPVLADIEVLVDTSLIQKGRDDLAGRFTLLDTVGRFASSLLDGGSDAGAIRERHCRYFAELVQPAREAFESGESPWQVAKPLLPDHANLRAAVEFALAAGKPDLAVSLALGLRPIWLATTLRREAHDFTLRLIDTFPVDAHDEIALLRAASFLERVDASQSGAHVFTRRLLSRAAEAGDRDAQIIATYKLAAHAFNAKDLPEARRMNAELMELVTPDLSPRMLGLVQYQLALQAYVSGDVAAASEHAARSAELFDEDGNPVYRAVRIYDELDAEIWPEHVVRDEAMQALGLDDLQIELSTTPAVDHLTALAEAERWLAERDPDERAPRRSRELGSAKLK